LRVAALASHILVVSSPWGVFEIDDRLERGLLDRQIGGLCALEDPSYVNAGLAA
jgi:hypothetical protein